MKKLLFILVILSLLFCVGAFAESTIDTWDSAFAAGERTDMYHAPDEAESKGDNHAACDRTRGALADYYGNMPSDPVPGIESPFHK